MEKVISYYELLGVSANASAAEIKKAYYRAMRLHHPDKHGDVDDPVARILNEAYAVLSNSDKRRAYDWKLSHENLPAVRRPQKMDVSDRLVCPDCDGSGVLDFRFVCQLCRGQGYVVPKPRPSPDAILCFECHGLGVGSIFFGYHLPCGVCHGAGWIRGREM